MRLVFMGTPEFAVPSLCGLAAGHDLVLVVTRPDRPRVRKSARSEPSPVKREALRLGVPVLQPESVREPELHAAVHDLSPDAIIVVAFGQILPPALLDLPPRWCINLHASLLPAYRGAAPIARAIMAGEIKTGVSTMRMDRGLDTGDVLLSQECAIAPGESAGELTDRLALLGAELLTRTMALHADDRLRPFPQDSARATFAPTLAPRDGLIDWTRPAASVSCQVRGCNPWPAARAGLRGQPVQILRAVPLASGDPVRGLDRSSPTGAAPGRVIDTGEGRLIVACGQDSLLEILELRFPGRRAVTALDAVNGRQVGAGDHFTSPA